MISGSIRNAVSSFGVIGRMVETCFYMMSSAPKGTSRPACLTPEQVARELDLPVRIVRRFIATGLLPTVELEPGLIRITPGDVKRFIATHRWLTLDSE